jgi:hypothetical protein
VADAACAKLNTKATQAKRRAYERHMVESPLCRSLPSVTHTGFAVESSHGLLLIQHTDDKSTSLLLQAAIRALIQTCATIALSSASLILE